MDFINKTRILVITASEELGNQICKWLHQESYDARCIVGAGEDTVEKAVELQPNMVIMDTVLPGSMNGLEAVAQIKTFIETSFLYMVNPDDELPEKSSGIACASGILLKPFSKKELLLNIETILYKSYMEKKVRDKERWLYTTLYSIGDGVIAADEDGLITLMNPAAEVLTGWTEQEALQQPVNKIFTAIYEDTGENVLSAGYDTVYDQYDQSDEALMLITRNQNKIPIEKTITPIHDEMNDDLGVVIIFRDVTQHREMEIKLQEMAIRDELSGLYNRTGFMTLGQQQLDTARRTGQKQVILYVDVNGMKKVNDTYGHSEGDEVIRITSDVLKKTFRRSDIIGRVGGDEFIVLGTLMGQHPEAVYTRLMSQIGSFNKESNKPYKIQVSAGLCVFDPDLPQSLEQLINQADRLMYKQKKNQRTSFSDQFSEAILLNREETSIHESEQ